MNDAPSDSMGDGCSGVQGQQGWRTTRRTAEGTTANGSTNDGGWSGWGRRSPGDDHDGVPSGWAGRWRRHPATQLRNAARTMGGGATEP
jgi:hypothetical protein